LQWVPVQIPTYYYYSYMQQTTSYCTT
jgi:hypothetical protein